MKIDVYGCDVWSQLTFISISKNQGCSGQVIRRVIYFIINSLADTSDKFRLSRIDLPEN